MFKTARYLAVMHGKKAAVGFTTAAGTVAAFAQSATTFDASTYVSQVTGTIAGMLAIGGAVFAVHLAIKSTKWGRKAL